MDYLHLYNHRIRMMNSPNSPRKTCKKCGSGYRGTRDPEESLCARCAVQHCQVPENIDEEFLRLVKEYHGEKFAAGQSLPTDDILVIMDDILDHRKRLDKLENDLKDRKDKGRMRMMREVKRIRDEKEVMETSMRKIKAKFMQFILTMPTRHRKAMSPDSQSKDEKKSPSSSISSASSVCTVLSPSSPSPKKSSKLGRPEVHISPSTPPASTSATDSPKSATRRSPPRKISPPKEAHEDSSLSTPEEPSPTPKLSPVKQAAAMFEETAKRVKNVVTFANPNPSIRKSRLAPPPQKQEVNNNNTPVTASSSSEEEDLENAGRLKRSNSVRDRIKRFEDLQRRASTGSYDRKRAKAAGLAANQHKSMMPLNK